MSDQTPSGRRWMCDLVDRDGPCSPDRTSLAHVRHGCGYVDAPPAVPPAPSGEPTLLDGVPTGSLLSPPPAPSSDSPAADERPDGFASFDDAHDDHLANCGDPNPDPDCGCRRCTDRRCVECGQDVDGLCGGSANEPCLAPDPLLLNMGEATLLLHGLLVGTADCSAAVRFLLDSGFGTDEVRAELEAKLAPAPSSSPVPAEGQDGHLSPDGWRHDGPAASCIADSCTAARSVPGDAERPGAWADGIGWVAWAEDLTWRDRRTQKSDPWGRLVVVEQWADGTTPARPAPVGGERPATEAVKGAFEFLALMADRSPDEIARHEGAIKACDLILAALKGREIPDAQPVPAASPEPGEVEPCGSMRVTSWYEGIAREEQWCARTNGPCPWPGTTTERDARPCAAADRGEQP